MPSLRAHLDRLVADLDVPARLASDPIGIVREHTGPDDLEVAALLASSLAFGNVVAIRKSIRRALFALELPPAAAVDTLGEPELRRRLRDFVHRVWTGRDLARLLAGAGTVRRAHGTLGAAFRTHLDAAPDFREALARFADDLRGPVARATPTLRHLVPDPRAGSACKRLLLYLRWMTRPADGVDLGLWPIPPSKLLIPVDVHVHRIGKNLGLTRRNDASWRTAEEITTKLRALDPEDPVRYDFALCHLGVSKSCPSRRDAEKCAPCSLRPVCVHHRR